MSEKTEQPTPKRLRDARKKGQVAKSREVGSTAIFLAVFGYLSLGWHFILKNLNEMILLPTQYYGVPFRQAMPEVVGVVVWKMVVITMPLVVTAMVMAVMADFLQFGLLFSIKAVSPDLNRLNPKQYFKKIFSIRSLVELIKSVIKVCVLGLIIKDLILGSIDALVKLPISGADDILPLLGSILSSLFLYTALAYLGVAALDFLFQKYQHLKQLKMTKDEVKREYKEMEGDPAIKSRRRQLHQEMVMSNTLSRVSKASVLVTNPTRRAIALYYDKDETKLPVILAKGKDLMAKRMIQVAKDNDIPIMQNVPLAHDLWDNGSVDNYIPSELIEPVAEVLRWVQELTAGKEDV